MCLYIPASPSHWSGSFSFLPGNTKVTRPVFVVEFHFRQHTPISAHQLTSTTLHAVHAHEWGAFTSDFTDFSTQNQETRDFISESKQINADIFHGEAARSDREHTTRSYTLTRDFIFYKQMS